jgi:hypothetical protein
MADAKVSVAIEAATGEARASLAEFGESIRGFAAGATKQLDALKKSIDFSTMFNAMRPAIDALAGLRARINECVAASIGWDRDVRGMARTLGVTTTEAGGLAKALGRLGSDTNAYTDAAFNLQRALMAQEAAFNANGIATRDAAGGMLPMQQVMMGTLDRLRQMKPGYDANALAMMAFGRGAKDLGGILKLTNGAIAEGTARVKEQGIEVGAGGAAADAYRLAMADVSDTMEALKIRVGQDLMPAIAGLSKGLAGMAQTVAPMLAKAVNAMAAVTEHWKTALIALLAVLKARLAASLSELAATLIPRAIAGVRAFIASLGPIGLAMTGVAAAVAVWDRLAGAADRAAKAAAEYAQKTAGNSAKIKQYEQRLLDVAQAMVKLNGKDPLYISLEKQRQQLVGMLDTLWPGYMKALGDAQHHGRTLAEAISDITAMREKEMEAALAAMDASIKSGKLGKDALAEARGAAEALRAELIGVKEAAMDAGAAYVAPRAKQPGPPKPGGADGLPPLPAPDTAGWDAAMAHIAAGEAAAAEQAKQLALLRLDDDRAEADHRVAMGRMTAEQRLEAEAQFVLRRSQIIEAAGQTDALAAQESANAIKQVLRDMEEEQSRAWRGLGASIKQSMGDAFVSLCNGTMGWGRAAQSVMDGALQGFLRMAAKELMAAVTLENAKTAAKAAGTSSRTALAWAGSAGEVAASMASALKGIIASAWEACAGAFKAMVGIPYVGPALAAGAGAAALAAVMAMTGNLKSAAGGYWDVPHDMLASIHKDEMVLPARHSAALRGMIEGGGGFGSPGGPSGQGVTLNVSAVDAKSFERYMKQNRGGIIRQLKGLGRDFAFNS